MPYVNFRWLGGMLTNFQTVHSRVAKLRELQRQVDSGEVDLMSKKEGLKVRRDLAKLERNLGGIKNLEKLPSAIFVIDTKKEHIAVTEANRLHIPVVAVVDTNCDPDVIDYVIPGNDDAIRSAHLMCRVIADAVNEGREHRAAAAAPVRARVRRTRRRAAARAEAAAHARGRGASSSEQPGRGARPRPRPSSARSRSGPARRRKPPKAAAGCRPPTARRRRPTAEAPAADAADRDGTQPPRRRRRRADNG